MYTQSIYTGSLCRPVSTVCSYSTYTCFLYRFVLRPQSQLLICAFFVSAILRRYHLKVSLQSSQPKYNCCRSSVCSTRHIPDSKLSHIDIGLICTCAANDTNNVDSASSWILCHLQPIVCICHGTYHISLISTLIAFFIQPRVVIWLMLFTSQS